MRSFTKQQAKWLVEKNKIFNIPSKEAIKEKEEDMIVFGIICLEMDDSMTSYTANAFSISYKDKRSIYEDFMSLCRVPSTYVELLWSQDVYYIPIFYWHGRDEDFLEQMDYIDGMVMIGGTVYNKFPSKDEDDKDKEIDEDYPELNLRYSEETNINKYP